MKKLIAIAIAAGMAAPAMADTTLYGQLHASVDFLDSDGAGTRSETSVSSNSSRIGVKGSVDLDSGLKAIYQAEWGMDTGGADSTGSTISNRNQVVGIAGGFGAVLLGRHDTPLKIVGRKADLFWSTQLGQNRNVTNPGTWDLRVNNVVAYQSPKMGGFQALAAYVTDLGGTDQNNAFSVNGIYNAGPLMVGAGYETHNLNAAPDQDAWRLMASYKFGAAKVVGYYQDEDNGAAADATVWGLGASYKVSANGTVKGQYYERNNAGTAADPALLAIGYDHKLGASTDVYAQYATISDGAKLGGAGHGESTQSLTGGDSDGFSVGIRHKF
jgi:predicted porin